MSKKSYLYKFWYSWSTRVEWQTVVSALLSGTVGAASFGDQPQVCMWDLGEYEVLPSLGPETSPTRAQTYMWFWAQTLHEGRTSHLAMQKHKIFWLVEEPETEQIHLSARVYLTSWVPAAAIWLFQHCLVIGFSWSLENLSLVARKPGNFISARRLA